MSTGTPTCENVGITGLFNPQSFVREKFEELIVIGWVPGQVLKRVNVNVYSSGFDGLQV